MLLTQGKRSYKFQYTSTGLEIDTTPDGRLIAREKKKIYSDEGLRRLELSRPSDTNGVHIDPFLWSEPMVTPSMLRTITLTGGSSWNT